MQNTLLGCMVNCKNMTRIYFTTVSNLTKSTGRLELSQLKSIRNRYASSMNETQLQALASEHTEESKYRLDQYNYSIYVMDEIINQY